MWYNRERRHSALGYQSPEAFEQAHQAQANIRLFSDSTKEGKPKMLLAELQRLLYQDNHFP